jgi:hypothetical protein
VTWWWWIEHQRVDDGIAGKARKTLPFRIIRMLIHIYKHVMTGLVRLLEGVIELWTSLFRWSRSDVPHPVEHTFARILPATPTIFKVTEASEWNFI